VPAPFAGVVSELKVAVGDRVSEGTTLLVVEVSGGNGASAPPDDEPHRPASEAGAPRSVESAIAAEVQSGDQSPPAPEPEPGPAPTSDAPVYASPAVRRLARERGVDLSSIQGSGRKGRITKEDLERPAPAAPTAGSAPSAGKGERVPLTRIQQLSRDALTRSWQTIPHVTQHDEADITELEAFRKSQADEAKKEGIRFTLLAFLIKAVVVALKQYPNFNASLSADGENLILKQYFHIGVAVDTPLGLVVPVIRDADSKGLLELAKELGAVSARMRDGKINPADLQGGCFSISSLGGLGGTLFTPIINAPEVAILGVGKSVTRPVWDGKQFAPRLMLPLSLSYDHRVIDGAQGARFIAFLSGVLSDIRRLVL
jgi:pyruvate dehydrogenase E2 component (dihydrolipoamide acetyltransferase)